MDAKDAIRSAMDISMFVLNSYLGDLSDEDLMRRPGPGCNHLAWQLGHLISSEAGLLSQINDGNGPELPPGFKEKHSKDTCGNDDPAAFCTKNEYLQTYQAVRNATLKVLEETPAAALDAPSPEMFRKMFPKVGDIFNLIGTHPLMHAGQFVVVRRELGKPIVI